jgi:hypothetical protein
VDKARCHARTGCLPLGLGLAPGLIFLALAAAHIRASHAGDVDQPPNRVLELVSESGPNDIESRGGVFFSIARLFWRAGLERAAECPPRRVERHRSATDGIPGPWHPVGSGSPGRPRGGR